MNGIAAVGIAWTAALAAFSVSASSAKLPVGRVASGKPVVVDFGPECEGGYPAAVVEAARKQLEENRAKAAQLEKLARIFA